MKREQQTEATRGKILESALAVFGREGYQGASMRAIGEHAGISKGIAYHYFKDKDDLYLCCVGQCFDQMLAFLEARDTGPEAPQQAVERFIGLRHDFLRQRPEYRTLFYETLFGRPHHLREQLVPIRARLEPIDLQFCRRMIGQVGGDGIDEAHTRFFGSMLQNALWVTLEQQQADPGDPADVARQEQLVADFLQVFFCGLQAQAAVPTDAGIQPGEQCPPAQDRSPKGEDPR